MGFLSDLMQQVGFVGGYTVIDFNGEYAYVEGVKRIRSVTATAIVFLTEKGDVTVSGEGLRIEEVDGGCVVVSGDITSEGYRRT